MNKARFQKEGQINLDDFTKVVRTRGGTPDQYTNHEIKQVFTQFAQQGPKIGAKTAVNAAYQEPFISIKTFKENFVNNMRFKRENDLFGINKFNDKDKESDTGAESDGFSSHAPSMLPDHILEGKKVGDVKRMQEERKKEADRILKQKLQAVMEQDEGDSPARGGGDALSQADSHLSMPLS